MLTTFSLLFFFLLLLSSTAPHLSLSSPIPTPTRRILHQPFFPVQSSSPPAQPPSPSSPSPPAAKYPFSGGSTPSSDEPFFPTYPSPPPPPPTPPSSSPFASFPANISSLILPHSPSSKPSKKLVAVTVALSLSAAVIAAVALFFFFRSRRQRRNAGDDDNKTTSRSVTTTPISYRDPRRDPPPPPPQLRKPGQNTSSEFLYLGTLVNSTAIDGGNNNGGGGGGGARRGVGPRKLDSPELHPLPPLSGRQQPQMQQQHLNQQYEEEDPEEFYSPRGSASGRESGSGSRRSAFEAVVRAHAQAEQRLNTSGRSGNAHSDEDSTSSSSSSSGDSPARSASISISPPMSNSPTKNPKSSSPEFIEMEVQSAAAQSVAASPPLPEMSFSPPYSLSSSPERVMEPIKEEEEAEESPLLSNASSSSRMTSPPDSPRLSPLAAKIGKATQEERDWGVLGRTSPSLSNASTPSRKSSSPIASLKLPAFLGGGRRKDSNSSMSTTASNSPVSLHSPTSPMSSTASPLSRHSRSYPASPLSRSSAGSSPRLSNASSHSSPRLSISSSGRKSPSTSARISSVAAVPPPPPPLPPMAAMRRSQSPPPPPPPPPMAERVVAATTPLKSVAVSQQAAESPVEGSGSGDSEETTPRPRLKPLHWDKVRASSDREMVWDQLRSSSFKLNEEMIETLFVVNAPNSNQKEMARKPAQPSPLQDNRVLDPKKAQNIAILLRALHVTMEEVCEALLEGNAETLGTELLESLLKMAPSKEEERKLKEYKDDSPVKLGHAEKFLKAVTDIPFAFKRVEAMLYMANFESEVEYLKRSFETLEAACDELRSSRMFLKLLEAVLKTGNRMNVGTNRGDAHAFKLDTLLKLVDVKGADGKTTLLHFVVQEISRTEGQRLSSASDNNQTPNDEAKCRKLGLQVVSGISSELANVRKAAAMDSDVLSNDVAKLTVGLANIAEVVRLNEQAHLQESTRKFSESMNKFMKMAEEDIFKVQAQERVALSLVKEITEYFHGNSAKEEAHPFRIFMVVRDFLMIVDRVCKEVGMINERTIVSNAHRFPVPVNPMLPVPVNPLFPGFPGRRQSSSSDDGSS